MDVISEIFELFEDLAKYSTETCFQRTIYKILDGVIKLLFEVIKQSPLLLKETADEVAELKSTIEEVAELEPSTPKMKKDKKKKIVASQVVPTSELLAKAQQKEPEQSEPEVSEEEQHVGAFLKKKEHKEVEFDDDIIIHDYPELTENKEIEKVIEQIKVDNEDLAQYYSDNDIQDNISTASEYIDIDATPMMSIIMSHIQELKDTLNKREEDKKKNPNGKQPRRRHIKLTAKPISTGEAI